MVPSAFEEAGEEPNFIGVCSGISSYAVLSRGFVLGLVSEGRLLVGIRLRVLILAEGDCARFVGCAENYGIIQKALNPGRCSVKGSFREAVSSASLLSLWAFPSPQQTAQSWQGTEAPFSVTGSGFAHSSARPAKRAMPGHV